MMINRYVYDDNRYTYDDYRYMYDDRHYIMMMAITCMLIGHRGWIT